MLQSYVCAKRGIVFRSVRYTCVQQYFHYLFVISHFDTLVSNIYNLFLYVAQPYTLKRIVFCKIGEHLLTQHVKEKPVSNIALFDYGVNDFSPNESESDVE